MSQNLAEKLLAHIEDIASRAVVKVHTRTEIEPRPIDEWASILPADMRDFYSKLNGITFQFELEGVDGLHGINLKALAEGGKTIDMRTKRYVGSYAESSSYGSHFFDGPPWNDDTKVLFVAGDDDASGIVMVGEGEDAKFYHWVNDGDVWPTEGSFTDIIERMMDKHFSAMWDEEGHPIVAEVEARLSAS